MVLLGTGLTACSGAEAPDTTVTSTRPSVTTGPPTTVAESMVPVWTDLDPAAPVPDPRSGVSMVYNLAEDDVILFGGWDADTDFGDTWGYDPFSNAWTDLAPSGDLPAPRALHQMVYDPVGGKVILFGGTSDAGRWDDTWAYDPAANTWTDLGVGGPAARSAHAMVFDTTLGVAILFGGNEGDTRFDDTWAYDPAANTWTDLDPAGSVPSARSALAMAYEPVEDRVILFGGYDGEFLNDTWAYDPTTNTWTDLDPIGDVPVPRANHRMVYDEMDGRVLLFGGYDGTTELYDVWAYSLATNTWADLDPIGPPPAREEHGMVYDPVSEAVLVFGGLDSPADRDLDDTWALSYWAD
jgi:N-acetylneuraminic acid mutarotase